MLSPFFAAVAEGPARRRARPSAPWAARLRPHRSPLCQPASSCAQVLVSQLAATKSAPTPEEKHLELQAAKRMYAAYCAASPPPAEPEICTNEILKKALGGPAEMVPFAKG
jgi:hypothetical protein